MIIKDIYNTQDGSLFGACAVLSPPIANFVKDAGYDTVEKFTAWVTGVPAERLPSMLPVDRTTTTSAWAVWCQVRLSRSIGGGSCNFLKFHWSVWKWHPFPALVHPAVAVEGPFQGMMSATR